jgi:hypothetical protein
LSAKQIILRDTWYPIHDELMRLSHEAPSQLLASPVSDASFRTWKIQETRGPKSKQKVLDTILWDLAKARSFATTQPGENPIESFWRQVS